MHPEAKKRDRGLSIKIDEIIRTRRKTIALVVTADARLIIRAPLRTSKDYIIRLVEKKRDWIERKQLEIARRKEAHAPRLYASGESFLFLGGSYRLEFSGRVSSVVLEGGSLLVPAGRKGEAAGLIREWYVREAQRIFTSRTEYYAALSGIGYRSVRASGAARRWGSCGVKGTLNLSWRLIMAPLRVVDSVVVHELAHIEFRNHSPKFWARVRAIMPDHEQQKKWLQENQVLLVLM